MSDRPFEVAWTPEGMGARVRLRGSSVLSSPMLNRGTAFTLAEREALGLTGLLPGGVSTIEGQLRRVYAQYLRQPDDLAKSLHLGQVRNRNEVLFYRLLTEHIHEMLRIVYPPTVGTVIERYSLEFQRPRGVYLSVDRPDQVEEAFRNYGLGADEVDLIVATDSEGILGIGDWGVGGIAIADGKLAVYTAAAGLHPRRVIPVVLDTGTDNADLLAEDMYLGSRHPRVRGERYDQLIEAYVSTAIRLFPNAMLHWEDFGAANARRILLKYAETCCTFNDDIQGTAAVVLAAALCATRAAGTAMRDQTVVIHGAGTAGIGIADALRQVMIDDGRSPGRVDRRAGDHRDRQPVGAGLLPRGRVPGRPGQQRAHLPGPRPRRHRQPGPPGQRRHAGRRGARAGRPGRRHIPGRVRPGRVRPGRGRAAPGHQPAGGVRRRRRGCPPAGPGRRAVRWAPRRPGP